MLRTNRKLGVNTWAVVLVSLLPFAGAAVAEEQGEVREVSLAQLIVNPLLFEGQRVVARGYLMDAGGLTYLALTREASQTRDVASSVPVARTGGGSRGEVPCLGGYVTLTGRFDKVWGEILGIVEIERAVIWDLEQGRPRECRHP
jgi:hypothetical protein